MSRYASFAFLLLLLFAVPARAQEAVILMYHRFGEAEYPSTDTGLDQLEAQIVRLREGGYHVLPLAEIVGAIKNGSELPGKSVAITVDDGYRSFLREGWPRFRAAGFPVTLFVPTDAADAGGEGLLGWDDLRALSADPLLSLGVHGAAHAGYAALSPEAGEADLSRAEAAFSAELGSVPRLFSYPYGEFGAQAAALVAGHGYEAGFGQQSGVAGPSDDLMVLPRFSLNRHYGEMARFRMLLDARHLAAEDVTPTDWLIRPETNPPALGFTLAPGLDGGRMTCYGPSGEGLGVDLVGGNRVVPRLTALAPGRSRVNCTLPDGQGNWYWRGFLFTLR
jgi:peptidoglycan/xylan/chitin deacetylase (PgdA/CDA1 family)